RTYREGLWSGWKNTDGGGTRRVESLQAWGSVRSELGEAAQADSVQLRYSIRCVPGLAADQQNCGDVLYGVLYDDLRLEVVSGAAVPAFDKPRVISRLFDPTSKTWSPFDSSELDANSVAVSGSDTILIDSRFRMNWPPRDKVASGAVLPGGFTINGVAAYSSLSFLPRG